MHVAKTDVFAGITSGMLSRMTVAPLDVIKIRMQLQDGRIGMLATGRSILQKEGFLAFWKGNAMAMCLWGAYTGVQFTAYAVIKRHLFEDVPHQKQGEGTRSQGFQGMLCGGLAGMVAVSASYPLDVLRTTLAADTSATGSMSLRGTLSSLHFAAGARSMFRGLLPAMLGIVPFMSVQFATYEWVSQKAKESKAFPETAVKGLAGFLGGVVGKTVTHPLDLVKKRLQVQGMQYSVEGSIRPEFSGLMDCVSKLVRQNGVQGLMKGWGPSTIKAAMASSVAFMVFDTIRQR